MNARRSIRTAAVAWAVVAGLAALSACSASGATDLTDGKRGGRLAVTASFYPLQFLAERIGGDHVSVTTLTKPGVEPHDLELSTRQAARLGSADVLLHLKGLQPAVDDAMAQSGVKHIVDAASLTTLEKHGTEVGPRHGDDSEAGHQESDPDGGDPHIWLDPVRFSDVAKGVGAAMEKADPRNARAYQANTDTLVGQLADLDSAYRRGLANSTGKTFITTHAAFGYLAERYGLKQEAIVGIDPDSEPSPARVKDLGTIAKRDKVTTVFFETLASDKTARTVARDSGLKTGVLDPVEGITDRSRGDDYIEVMRANLAALRTALGAR